MSPTDPKDEVKLEIPTIVNVTHVDKELKSPTLLHFTSEQWKSVLKSGKEVKKEPPENSLFLEATLMPGGRGDVLGRIVNCYPPCNIVTERLRLPDGHVYMIRQWCSCPLSPECKPAFKFIHGPTGVIHTIVDIEFVCLNDQHQVCKDFSPVWVYTNGGWYLYCVKKP